MAAHPETLSIMYPCCEMCPCVIEGTGSLQCGHPDGERRAVIAILMPEWCPAKSQWDQAIAKHKEETHISWWVLLFRWIRYNKHKRYWINGGSERRISDRRAKESTYTYYSVFKCERNRQRRHL